MHAIKYFPQYCSNEEAFKGIKNRVMLVVSVLLRVSSRKYKKPIFLNSLYAIKIDIQIKS